MSSKTASSSAGAAQQDDGGASNSLKSRRTRGPRSCLQCRGAKQRCEAGDVASIVPSNDPQPPHMACRRCRVLLLACIVPDQLPKSTRLRLERSQNAHGTLAHNAARDSSLPSQSHHHHPYTDRRHESTPRADASGWSHGAHLPTSQPPSVYAPSNALAHTPSTKQYPHEPSGAAARHPGSAELYQPSTFAHHDRAQQHYAREHHAHVSTSTGAAFASPSSSSVQGSGRSSQSPMGHAVQTGGGATRFEPVIFDPMPIMKGITSTSNGNAGPQKASASPSTHAAPMSSGSGFSAIHRQTSASSMPPPSDSPHSQSSGGLDAAGEPTWYYRARIACRPMQLMEHLLASTPFPSGGPMPNLAALPRLEEVVQMILATNDAAYVRRLERRMLNIQRALPFMPTFPTCASDVENSVFLLAVIIHLEGHLPANEAQVLYDHLTVRCLHYVDHPPGSMYDIGALFIVVSFCPLLLKAPNLVGVVSGSALILSISRAADAMNITGAPAQLAAYVEQFHRAGVPLPQLDSAVVQHAFVCLYLTMQELILDMVDDPMPRRGQPPHPRQGYRHGKEQRTGSDADTIDRYCRAMIESSDMPLHTAPSSDVRRCASMILLVFGARVADSARSTMKSFHLQFDEQVIQVPDTSARVMALRRWTDQAIESLGIVMSGARESLRETANYLGMRRGVGATQLKLTELNFGAIEFSCLCQLKDKLYIAGHGFLGASKTSQDFLFGIFARPQLLRSYEALGVVRACVAKHVLMLLANLSLDLSPRQRRKSRPADVSHTTRDEPLHKWGALADILPIARWGGILSACVTVIVEELAGRFLAQEAPWGAQGESRLELYTMLVRHTYDVLLPFEDDVTARYPTHYQHHRPISAALDVLDKSLLALITWRKKASGIGPYSLLSASLSDVDADDTGIPDLSMAGLMKGSVTSSSNVSLPPMPLSASPVSSSSGVPSVVKLPPDVAAAGAPSASTAMSLDQVHFGDALLHDILFTPIEQFFGVH